MVRGGDFGWNIYEGTRENDNPDNEPPEAFEQPILDYEHDLGRSITGGSVYRGSRLGSLLGAYVYGDYTSGRVWALVHDGQQVVHNVEVGSVHRLSSFGESAAGELFALSHQDGVIYRFEESVPEPPPPFPAALSDTGLFRDVASLEPAPGLIEYGVASPQWSDGALQRRWLALPGLAQIGFTAEDDGFSFPVGTVLVQHLELQLDSEHQRRLETRVLVHERVGWSGYTYRWNDQQDDAVLLGSSLTETYEVEDPQAPGGRREQTWTYPSRTDCRRCHTSAAGVVLGARTRQLNRSFSYPLASDNQLRAWNHIGLFDEEIGAAQAYEALVDPADPEQDVAERARAYLAANCSHCHLPGGPAPGDMDLRASVHVEGMNLVNVRATEGDLGIEGAYRLLPHRKEQSVLWERLRRRDGVEMPPLASSEVDVAAVDLIGLWIDTFDP